MSVSTARARRRPFLRSSLAALLASAAAVACSGGGDAGGSAGTTAPPAPNPLFASADVQVRAQDIDFPQRTFDAPPGAITVAYLNEGKIFHTLVLEQDGERLDDLERLEVSRSGDVDAGTVTLAAGEYVLYCDIPGHRANGMEARLVVR